MRHINEIQIKPLYDIFDELERYLLSKKKLSLKDHEKLRQMRIIKDYTKTKYDARGNRIH